MLSDQTTVPTPASFRRSEQHSSPSAERAERLCVLTHVQTAGRVDASGAEKIIAEGGQWLDVRLPSEFEAYHNDGAINVPLYFIRLKLKTLDPSVKYVVCCDTGRRSSAGAFILNERGFQTYVLKGGLNRTNLQG